MKSIRRYLQARIVWGSSAILAVGSVLLGLAIRRLDIREFDTSLETKARTLATLVLREGRSLEVDFAGEYMPEFETTTNTEYFQFRLRDGSVIERSDMLGERDLPFLPKAIGAPLFMNLRLPDGRPGRFVQISFPPRSGDDTETPEGAGRFRIPDANDPASIHVVLGVARSRKPLESLLLRVYFTLAGVDALLVGLIALLVHQSLGKGFRPIEELNAQISSLGPGTLERRIRLPDAPAEVAMLPTAVNGFVTALQAAFAREQRFTSNVAHELRTPVAEFRAACEVGAKWSDDPALVRRRFENLQESTVNMERILNGLLDLSRLDRGAVEVRSTETHIAPLVDSCWARVCGGGDGAGHRLENRIEPSLRPNTDPVKLDMILLNLLTNAACYSVPESAVICTSKRSPDGAWEVCISNHAQALEREDLDHLFDRFWRKDAARTGGRHSGLGLSIVKAIADALGIRLTVDLTSDNFFTVSLRFPAQGTA